MCTHQFVLNINSPVHRMNTSRAEDTSFLIYEQAAKIEDDPA